MGKSSSLSPSSSSRTLPSMFSGSDRRRGSLRSMAEVTGSDSDPARNYRSRLCFHGGVPDESEESHYFLDSCFRCKTPLHVEDDIYMYRGDTPFCSEECREEQIEIDEAEERRRCKAKKKKMMLMMGSSAASSSPSSCHEIHVRAAAGALVAG